MYYNKKRRRIFNAIYKNISLRGTYANYSMVRVFSRSIDRDQSYFPHSLFFFRIGKKEKEEKWIEPA